MLKDELKSKLQATIIFDCHGTCHALRHSIGNDMSFEGQSTGIIFGFLSQIFIVANIFNPSHIVFAWDPRSSFRKDLYPWYKQYPKKEKTFQEIESDALSFKQFDLLRKEILPKLGFRNQLMQDGLEADDIIASVVQSEPGWKVIVSRDNDFYQLLSENCCLWRGGKVYTSEHFQKEYGINPRMWYKVKAIAGCSSDRVPGITGVGEKTAIKYLTSSLKEGKVKSRIESSSDTIIRNIGLVKLPFQGIKKEVIQKDLVSLNNFKEVCKEFGFHSFLQSEKLEQWKRVFKMKE